jgi:hypothetical protein
MEPVKLRLPAPLAALWPALLRRECFEIESDGAEHGHRLRCGSAEFHLTTTVLHGETTLDTSGVGDQRIRRRLELTLRANGARYTVEQLNDVAVDALYRCEPSALFEALEELRQRGVPCNLEQCSPLCATLGVSSSARCWRGTLGTSTHSIRLETGVGCTTPSAPTTIFVAASPQYRIWASRGLRVLVAQLDSALCAHSATRVVRSVLLG